mmetsp:Transcript_1340/g.4553  ORF Transcript_1340/g.4553 Transcript_1340/m.4553 type:complete len:281 (-) Transcript_1340:1600-2442(-)
MVSARAKACAMFVKPRCHFCCMSLSRTFCRSKVNGWTWMADSTLVVPSGMVNKWPLPNRTTPILTASLPKNFGWYLFVRFTAKFRRTSKPSAFREPLASSAMIKSCCAMQISSPVHSCVLHCCSWKRLRDVFFGHLPWPRMGTSTLRVCVVTPPLQAMEHGAQSDQSSSLQSRSQDPVLQDRSSCTASQPVPPFFGLTRMERVFTWTPLSHSLVHFVQPDHDDIEHETGHFFWPQRFGRSRGGHLIPNRLGTVTMSRFMVSLPPQRNGSARGQVSSQRIA